MQHAFSADTLRDRVAIVTGASQGIGRAIALELAKVGADVVACSRRQAGVDAVAGDVRALGRRALGMACDVGDAAQVDEVVVKTHREFGRIDLLVNNAGYRIRARLEDLPRAEWDTMLRTNLTGVFLFSQAVGRVMIRQQSGKIVNVTSVAGRSGSRGMAAYAAAKAGVTALPRASAPSGRSTASRSTRWRRGRRRPKACWIAQASREVPLQRLARPEEIAWAVIFVASDAADFMTGETLYVSGGPRVANRED